MSAPANHPDNSEGIISDSTLIRNERTERKQADRDEQGVQRAKQDFHGIMLF